MDCKKYLLWGLGLGLLLVPGVMAAAPAEETLVFSQTVSGKQTIYLYQSTAAKPVPVVSGSKITVFLQQKHFYYFLDHGLFEYNPAREQAKLIHKFIEDQIQMRVVAAENGLNQLLVVASAPYLTNGYILDVNEASLRRIELPAYASTVDLTAVNVAVSPDEKYTIAVKGNVLRGRISLLLQQKKALKKQTVWELPSELSVMPDLVTWAPDGKILLFYAKPATGFEGFYSLYALRLDNLKLQLLAESVLYRDLIGSAGLDEFLPSWAADGRYVVFQSQPTGSPAQSLLLKYDFQNGKITTLTASNGQNQYPRIAPSGKWVAFLSNRDQGEKKLYLVDQQGQGLKRLTSDGVAEWAQWYQQ